MTGNQGASPPDLGEDGEVFLAALGNFDILKRKEALAILNVDRDRYLVAPLPMLPDDGIGVGEATLSCIPALAQGEQPHRATWVVRIDYDGDGPDDFHLGTFETEAEARTFYADLVQQRLDDGFSDPNVAAPSE